MIANTVSFVQEQHQWTYGTEEDFRGRGSWALILLILGHGKEEHHGSLRPMLPSLRQATNRE